MRGPLGSSTSIEAELTNRIYRFGSSLDPIKLQEALRRRAEGWRESATPPDLRPRGIQGLVLQSKRGGHFRLQWNYPSGHPFIVACKGRISPYGSGSLVEARIVEENYLLVMPAGAAVIMLASMIAKQSWDLLGFFLAMCGVFAFAAALRFIGRNPGHVNADAAELERVLFGVAGPIIPLEPPRADV